VFEPDADVLEPPEAVEPDVELELDVEPFDEPDPDGDVLELFPCGAVAVEEDPDAPRRTWVKTKQKANSAIKSKVIPATINGSARFFLAPSGQSRVMNLPSALLNNFAFSIFSR